MGGLGGGNCSNRLLEEALMLFLFSCNREKRYDATGSFMTELNRRSIALLILGFGFGGFLLVIWVENRPSSPFIVQSYKYCFAR